MKKSKFDVLMLLLSLVMAFLGGIVCFLVYNEGITDTAAGRILWSGMLFSVPLACGLGGVCIVERIRAKKMRLRTKIRRGISLLLALGAGFLIGAVGQALFMISWQETFGAADIVLLLDGSSSMRDYKEPVAEAAGELIDSLREECAVQVVSFSGNVLGKTELVPMDAAGKQKTKAFIDAIDVIGGTNFNAALSTAMETLDDASAAGRGQAVIMLTDGRGELDAELIRDYYKSDIAVYTIRISTAEAEDADTRALIQFAEQTGGFDILVSVGADGKVRTDTMIEAFSKAFEAAKGMGMGDQMMIYDNKQLNWPRFLVRLAAMVSYAVLAAWVYYGRPHPAGLLINVAAGVFAVFIMCNIGTHDEREIVLTLFLLLFWGAYTVWRPAKGGDLHV